MKIDRKDPRHWLYLGLSAVNVMLALLLRALPRRRQAKSVVLYGHKLAGNLRPIYDELASAAHPDIRVTYLTLDPNYDKQLSLEGIASVSGSSLRSAWLLGFADALITDHGLHTLIPLLWFSNVKFFDVWHGIPFKGFDPDDFRVQRRYDEAWVASPLMAKLYVNRFGFDERRVAVTGYSRTDRLVRRAIDPHRPTRSRSLLDRSAHKIVTFAPTWSQDSQHRDIYPFGLDEGQFCSTISHLAQRHNSIVTLRTHLNTNAAQHASQNYRNLEVLPSDQYPNTEDILLATDILVCDWSSIAFDYLLVLRPTIFLDVEPPFAKGFSLGPQYRFGPVEKTMKGLIFRLNTYLEKPEIYDHEYGERAKKVAHKIYGGYADGLATSRCVQRLRLHLGLQPPPHQQIRTDDPSVL